jgi:hypothetical protein
MTNFRPSDWDDGPVFTRELEVPNGFEFSELLKSEHSIEASGVILICITDPDLLNTLASFAFEYTFTGKICGLGGPNADRMVEYGVSRFKKSSEGPSRAASSKDPDRVAETDEPLAILGLFNFLGKQNLNFKRYLRETVNVPHDIARALAFESFCAYILARAFSTPTPLSDVFEFIGESKLTKETAELVTLEKIDDIFQITPLTLESTFRPSHVIGCSPSTTSGTLEWLQNPGGSAFCFPSNLVGPDLIFVLRLTSDNTLLRVCVQIKHTKELGPAATEKAIRTTDPFNFLSQVKDGKRTISDPSMQQNMVEAIQCLGTGTDKAGKCGVLRVVVSHPSRLSDNELDSAAESGVHPLATVPIKYLEPTESDLGQTILSLAQRVVNVTDRKRKRTNEIDGTQFKRQKTGARVPG